jgi:hypothetical protein
MSDHDCPPETRLYRALRLLRVALAVLAAALTVWKGLFGR